MNEWDDWSDEALIEYEQGLFDDEMAGQDTWFWREAALEEMRRRELI
jgi:hypothetical protein